jgi:hypothetical protein
MFHNYDDDLPDPDGEIVSVRMSQEAYERRAALRQWLKTEVRSMETLEWEKRKHQAATVAWMSAAIAFWVAVGYLVLNF